MVVIPGPAEFLMGSPATEKDRQEADIQHKRRIRRTFAIAATLVTEEQILRFLPSHANAKMKLTPEPSLPHKSTTWYEAAAYCNWLSKKEGIPEAQWCYETD